MLLEQFNAAPADEVTAALRTCCDVPRWAEDINRGRPYADLAAVLGRAERAARRWTSEDVDRALAAHPRIGERATGDSPAAAWSREEQSGVDPLERALVEGNRAYEERFGRVFLICASGLSATDIADALQERLANDDEREAAVVAEELRSIALLRLERVFAS